MKPMHRPSAVLVVLALAAVLCSRSVAEEPGIAPASAESSKPRTVEELLESAGRWVVAIEVERTKDVPTPATSGPQMPPLPHLPPEMRSYYERPKGWVSGLLVDGTGHVLTSSYNVAGEVKSLRVRLAGGETFPARLVAKSPSDDMALLQIERAETDPPIPFHEPLWADASRLRHGQMVFALGRSPDPGHITATRGILSAVGRNGGRAVQTDAELNYGNAGGPIVDLDGRIVAVASFIGHTQPQWGINSGVGFGTSAAAVLEMLPSLVEGKDFVAFRIPFLGVQGDRRFLGGAGAKIDLVVAQGPAGKAGLQAGDIVLEYGRKAVDSFDHLRRLIFAGKVGDKVSVKVRRGDAALSFDIVLEELPPS
jgi:serine protease Do